MNSYQRRQHKRRIIFGLRKLGKAAAKAGKAFETMAYAFSNVCASMTALKKAE